MLPIKRWAVVVCAALAPVCATAQRGLTVAGGVFEDRMALAVRPHFVGAADVTLKLYRDGGDRQPGADDTQLATTKTDRAGMYAFNVERAGDYWLVVDSKTIGTTAGAWAEQTFGPAGSLCAHPNGTVRTTLFEGSCFAGRNATRSDDASSPATAEHLALISVKDGLTGIDFAFSFDAVVNTEDGPAIQGSFRQFLANANAIPGPNRMRFVPLTPATEQRDSVMGVPPHWWTITAGTPLPAISNAETVIDGTPYNFLSPASVSNPNPGRLGESVTFQANEPQIPHIDKPDLELVLTGEEGIVCAAGCAITRLAVHGTPISIITRADARLEHLMVGAAPDADIVPTPGAVGVQVEQGTTVMRYSLIAQQTRAGVIVASGARLDAERLDVSRCGDPQTGGGIVLLSDGSVVRASNINTNPGAGVLIGSPDGKTAANGNTIDGCTISGNQAGIVLSPAATRNVITRNDVMWNRLGGVTILPIEEGAPTPRENRFSANRFNENGLRPIVLNLNVDDPNALTWGSQRCERDAKLANGGISPPRVTRVRVSEDEGVTRATVRGTACPGEIVEIYQSFVTTGVREKTSTDLPHVRRETIERESITTQDRTLALPSIGEFNYLGATNTAADGTFEATFPLPVTVPMTATSQSIEETNIWASQVLPGAKPEDRAFSALAIDAAGNTSEMSVRRKVD
ncbi:MAG TPA: right-handed parallel beta-helix repeat-containing protein [Thermoanaerobaculia bacterium]|nr:right-handed parallel beta-helix repeat-containing protein [Thermoanaerobaculia bacterium]